ncbi:MAG TPA: hypothetical protein VFE15_08345 [Marmoricola sp.]|jgi:hypothetical protein|nr:hypothetical protein [Marmoricola sp.]
MNSTFTDLAPTETDAAGVVGGDFASLGPAVVALLGIVVSVFGHID